MFRDLRAILGWIDFRLRLQWLALVPIMCLAALLEAAGAIAVFGLLRMVVEPQRVRSAPVVSQIWQAWPTDDPPAIVAVLTGVVAALYVVRALFLMWTAWVKERTLAMSAARAGEKLFSQYLTTDYLFHLQRRSASLIQEIARSTDVAFQLVVSSLVDILAELATIGALIAVLFYTAPANTMGAVALVLALAAVPMLMTRRLWVRFGDEQRALEEQQLHVLQQSLGAVKEVKIGGRESYFESRFRSVRRALAATKQRRAWIATSLRLAVETVLIVALLMVALLVTLGRASGAETVSLLALFAYTIFRVVPSSNRILLNAGYLREGRSFIKAAIADAKRLRVTQQRGHGPEPVVDFTQSLVCENVSFSYEPGAPSALSDVFFRLSPGESVGIVGATGSGKSTLVDLLLGLLRPTSGRILLDGQDLAGRERAWQRHVGYVPQDPYLLDDSVRHNIAFGVPDTLVDEHSLATACSLAKLDEVVRQLPQGLDTMLGENGTRLSGGERQRVAIARALYADPAVLVFDEATAALDNQTEREVTSAIAALHGARTLIVIAHRLSTVQGCDRLVFLKEGRIAATGTYNELLRDPNFRAMAHA